MEESNAYFGRLMVPVLWLHAVGAGNKTRVRFSSSAPFSLIATCLALFLCDNEKQGKRKSLKKGSEPWRPRSLPRIGMKRISVIAGHFTCSAHDETSLVIHPDVRAALDGGRPVVALESTIVSHGERRLGRWAATWERGWGEEHGVYRSALLATATGMSR
jgi:hypothetical protein